jgi:hypothetical protein
MKTLINVKKNKGLIFLFSFVKTVEIKKYIFRFHING